MPDHSDWTMGWRTLFPAWALRNPAIALTLTYLFVSAMGIAYSVLFYSPLGINIFIFAEPSDFFLMPFRHPHSLIASAFLLFFYAVFHLAYWRPASVRYREALWANDPDAFRRISIEGLEFALERARANPLLRILQSRTSIERALERERTRSIGPWTFQSFRVVVLLLLPVAFVALIWLSLQLYVDVATSSASAVRLGAGVKDRFVVQDASGIHEVDAVLVGTTNRYLFLFDGVDERVLVVPHDALLGIRVTSVN